MSTTTRPVGCTTQAPAALTTTLYDLIAALQEAAGPDEDALVVAAVVDLIGSRRLTWRPGSQKRHRPRQDRSRGHRSRQQPALFLERPGYGL